VIIRKAAPADIPALAEVAERSYGAAFRAFLSEAELATRNRAYYVERFGQAWDRIRVAVAHDRIVGFCLMTGQHVDMLFVQPDRTGQGIGKALLRHAVASGAATLECFAENRSARRFYEREGWRVVREYTRASVGQERTFLLYAAPGVALS
jgi:putative acetyltransferase